MVSQGNGQSGWRAASSPDDVQAGRRNASQKRRKRKRKDLSHTKKGKAHTASI